MSRIISERLKEELKKSRFTYEAFAREIGRGTTKQNICDALSKRDDDNWKYLDIVKWCSVLEISLADVLKDVR